MQPADPRGFSFERLLLDARSRWLKPPEILFLLQNVRESQVKQKPPSMPPSSGSIIFYNKRVLRNFRLDGHSWRKKRDGKTINEAHEKLKVGNSNALNCYYAHGEYTSYFQRRSYWMLNSEREHIALVHYLDVSEVSKVIGSISADSGCSDNATNYMASQGLSLESQEEWGHYNTTCSTDSVVEVSSDTFAGTSQIGYPVLRNPGETAEPSREAAFRHLAAQLSLEDDYAVDQPPHPSHINLETEWLHNTSDYSLPLVDHVPISNGLANPEFSSNSLFGKVADDSKDVQLSSHLKENNVTYWMEMLKEASTDRNLLPSAHGGGSDWIPSNEKSFGRENLIDNASTNENVILPSFDDACFWGSAEASTDNATLDMKFSIREISPNWAYSTENTKVIITGDFLSPLEGSWAVMFGDTEVPVDIIQQGVLRCWTPLHAPGSIKLCITSGNRIACSDAREFIYLTKPETSNLPEKQRNTDELLLLVNFVHTLLCKSHSTDARVEDGSYSEIGHFQEKTRNDRLERLLAEVLVSSDSPSRILDMLLEELLREKLMEWLGRNSQGGERTCLSSKHEHSIIHMLSGLGFEWALKPVLDSGIGVNFRDFQGWTALHWAARFGREKMCARLLAAGALAGAVTDPTRQDPLGKTPASVAAEHGHKGLAGYLAEIALTSHLNSLTFSESEISIASANEDANAVVQGITKRITNKNFAANEDQFSLNDSLGAVVNAAQAAARIQSAFRAYSFRKNQGRTSVCLDEYGMSPALIHDAMSKHHKMYHGARDKKIQVAALHIQKMFRGWKRRKSYLNLRKNVVKIQAHVRGHQVRKRYRFSMTVSILEKVILRWRRKGVGLRGHRTESISGLEDSYDVVKEEEEILKVFRKQKVDDTLKAAVSRVLSMVESPEARQQYCRMLESYQQVKAELGDSSISALNSSSTQMDEITYSQYYTLTEDDQVYHGGTYF